MTDARLATRIASVHAASELRPSVPQSRVLLFDRGAKFELNAIFRSERGQSDDVVVTLDRTDFFGATTAVATRTIRVVAQGTADMSFAAETSAWPRGLHTLAPPAARCRAGLLARRVPVRASRSTTPAFIVPHGAMTAPCAREP